MDEFKGVRGRTWTGKSRDSRSKGRKIMNMDSFPVACGMSREEPLLELVNRSAF